MVAKAWAARSASARRDVDVGIQKVIARLGIVLLEIEAARTDFDRRKSQRQPLPLASLRPHGVIEQRHQVPAAFRTSHEVHAGLQQSKPGEGEPAGQDARKSDARIEFLHVRKWFDAEARILLNQHIVDGEAGAGKEIQMNAADLDLAAERAFECFSDVDAEPVGIDKRRADSGDGDQQDSSQDDATDQACARHHTSSTAFTIAW